MAKRLNKDTLDAIKNDSVLFGMVANLVGVKPTSLPVTLDRNGNNLNQYSIVAEIAEYLKKTPDEILEDDSQITEEDTINESEKVSKVE